MINIHSISNGLSRKTGHTTWIIRSDDTVADHRCGRWFGRMSLFLSFFFLLALFSLRFIVFVTLLLFMLLFMWFSYQIRLHCWHRHRTILMTMFFVFLMLSHRCRIQIAILFWQWPWMQTETSQLYICQRQQLLSTNRWLFNYTTQWTIILKRERERENMRKYFISSLIE